MICWLQLHYQQMETVSLPPRATVKIEPVKSVTKPKWQNVSRFLQNANVTRAESRNREGESKWRGVMG